MSLPILKIITTEDGSHSIYREDINETYHSSRGAKGESDHIFIKMGLRFLLEQRKLDSMKIFEVGLGTGLNVLLSAQFAGEHSVYVEFHSIEPIPLTPEIYKALNFGQDENSKNILRSIHESTWEEENNILKQFKLTKYETTLESFEGQSDFDIVFFDAFAPSKQPEVWSLENIKKCYSLLKPGGILTTYCAQGQFKRNLKEAGFLVETLPGAMGKKEMVRGIKP